MGMASSGGDSGETVVFGGLAEHEVGGGEGAVGESGLMEIEEGETDFPRHPEEFVFIQADSDFQEIGEGGAFHEFCDEEGEGAIGFKAKDAGEVGMDMGRNAASGLTEWVEG